MLVHQHKNSTVPAEHRRYTDVMKKFATTLYFYSPKAYNFVKEHFILPNGRTIRKWLSKTKCYPGFLTEVFQFLKEELLQKPDLKNCALIFDSMSIRKQIIWDNAEGRFTGNVDYGGMIDPDFDSPASEALFIQIVSYRSKFKCPIAYFLINKIDSDVQTQLVTCSLRYLFEIGIVVRSITCDGAATNIKTLNSLGCKLVAGNSMQSWFYHPCAPDIKVYCMLDTCHMIKLARNCLADKQLSTESGTIDWKYVKYLNDLQTEENLRLANSLTAGHINFKNKIMNVRLAAQVMSSSVANAIDYLRLTGLETFQGSEETVNFIRILDRTFDMLNSRSPFGKGFKAPIRPESVAYFSEAFSTATKYLTSLKVDGMSILHHPRKTFVLGFVMNMQSILELARDLFSSESPLKYFLSYKCSQDHLELYFSCIRSRGGWNNNPNALQLRWALRQLLQVTSVKSSVSANCMDFDTFCTPAFEFRSEKRSMIDKNSQGEKSFDFLLECVNRVALSDYAENVLYYIAGFITRRMVNSSNCQDCINILLFRNETVSDHSYSSPIEKYKRFTNFTSNGGLVYAAEVVFKIIQFTEKNFRYMCETNKIKDKNLKNLLRNAAVHEFCTNLHLFLPVHPPLQEFIAEELHEIQIIKQIVDNYLKCRMSHHARLMNENIHGESIGIRQKFNKLILFNNL